MAKEKFKQIIIPSFVFAKNSIDVFHGYDRGCCPVGFDLPRCIEDMGVFDKDGNYYTIHIDTRKKKIQKNVSYILDGQAHYHPIVKFLTNCALVNPSNGHLFPHEGCAECNEGAQELKKQTAHKVVRIFADLLYKHSVREQEVESLKEMALMPFANPELVSSVVSMESELKSGKAESPKQAVAVSQIKIPSELLGLMHRIHNHSGGLDDFLALVTLCRAAMTMCSKP